jgi:MFS family permease
LADTFLIPASITNTHNPADLNLTIVLGFCAGAASLIVPIYVGEIAEDKIRGLLCSCFQVMVTLGNLTVYVLGTYVTWQWLAFVCGLIQLFGLALMVFVPSSPTYLLSKNRTIDAVGSLMSLRGTKSYQDIEHEFDMVINYILSFQYSYS